MKIVFILDINILLHEKVWRSNHQSEILVLYDMTLYTMCVF